MPPYLKMLIWWKERFFSCFMTCCQLYFGKVQKCVSIFGSVFFQCQCDSRSVLIVFFFNREPVSEKLFLSVLNLDFRVQMTHGCKGGVYSWLFLAVEHRDCSACIGHLITRKLLNIVLRVSYSEDIDHCVELCHYTETCTFRYCKHRKPLGHVKWKKKAMLTDVCSSNRLYWRARTI